MTYLNSKEPGGEGSRGWTLEVFRRAYGLAGGPFARVKERLELGFSQLVYLPGSCMNAAAEHISGRPGETSTWAVVGQHPGSGKSMQDAWNATTSIIDAITRSIKEDARRPDVIFKNLDRLFTDSAVHNSLIQDQGARISLFSLIESTRAARTLGLADRAFGKLPDAVESAFAEISWLDQVGAEQFKGLIPVELAAKLLGKDRLEEKDKLPDGTTWLLASRLRWTDPIRSVLIMLSIASNCRSKSLSDVLTDIWKAVRPNDFVAPNSVFSGNVKEVEKSFPKSTTEPIVKSIIEPYRRCRDLAKLLDRSSSDFEREMRKLSPGIILFGPPGTGKTYLAQWIAASIDLPIRVESGAKLRSSGFGDTERNIVRLFREARRAAPCVLVLDDADDLLVNRSKVEGTVAGAERAIVNTILQELAGFDGRLAGVLVVLTTNRFALLDEAIRGRLSCHVQVPYPLNTTLVERIVNSIAQDFGFVLNAEIRERLIKRFMAPVLQTGTSVTLADEDQRAAARENQFSPREIQQAMRLLQNMEDAASPDGSYRPTEGDVDRMTAYYQDLAKAPEMQDRSR